jgi:tetratricopeptide (TPR) repeat protein
VLRADGDPVVSTSGPVDPYALGGLGSGDLDRTIAALQAHLRLQPRDARGWATLGLSYVEKARLSGDPTYYPKAQQVLRRSQSVQPKDNDLAVAGAAALYAARHDFTKALRAANRSLSINRYQPGALAIRTDALTELGRYRQALNAAWHADRLQPGLPSFARLSYAYELRGRQAKARSLLERAVAIALAPVDAAFARTLLADLDRRAGRLAAAERQLRIASRADPQYVPAMVSRARLLLARGETAAAIRQLRNVVELRPLPEYLLLLGELYEVTGRPAQAKTQYDVLRAADRLLSANGVSTDLEVALFEADHGDPGAALAAARSEWSRRQSIYVADALGWALYRSGRERRALHFAELATRLHTQDPLLLFHRGAVESALAMRQDARRHLRVALAADPGFSPLQAAEAARLLHDLKGSG